MRLRHQFLLCLLALFVPFALHSQTPLIGVSTNASSASPNGMNYQGTYSATTTYAENDVVTVSGATYVSLISSNKGNAPASTPSDWLALGNGSSYNGGTVANPVTAPSFVASGTGAGSVTLTAGPAPTAPTNSVVLAAPSAVTTPYVFSPPAAPPGNTALTISCSGTTATICNWVTAGAGWTGSFQTQNAGGNYSDWSFNGNHADGTRLGCVGALPASGDPSLYCDVPTGGQFQFRVNNVHVANIDTQGFNEPLASPVSSAPCSAGDIKWDANFIYICVATNTWKRSTALATY